MMVERLRWEQEAAPVLEQLRLRDRDPVPWEREILDREPEVDQVVAFALVAFDELQTTRGFYGWIPVPEVRRWCREHGLDWTATEILTRAIHHADKWVVSEQAKQAKQAKQGATA